MVGLLVHEWIEPHGGSERVLEVIAETFPTSDIVVPWNNAPWRTITPRVRESWLARSPIRNRKAAAAVALPAVWRGVVGSRKDYDWVLASTHLFSHHVKVEGLLGRPRKFVYVHSPARYIWNPELDARGDGTLARAIGAALKPIDRRRAQEAHAIAANSEFVRARVEAAWRRDAVVINPPVDVDRIMEGAPWADRVEAAEREVLDSLPDVFVLGASRFVSYKRLDLVIRAGEAAGLPVVLAGEGPLRPELEELAAQAGVPVHFVERPSSPLLYALYEAAAVFVFPAVEDFGMMPVEAMAAGAPVVANGLGGARESVTPGVSGVLVDGFAAGELREAVDAAMSLDRASIPDTVRRFSVPRFQERIDRWVGEGVR
ncbi:glycosyltransferase [Amnibacterium setariae]|uniref:D-inositol 3-phosphate glycosyltransferase n=1 Tax=Amnibacterium setariae TaxID=2306585 RepID=A0A3A1TUS5_9MICO|nr:glycosyltransferase [Amnibacterium setariae]